MSNPRYDCPIPGCQETRVYKDIVNHILKHSSEEISKFTGLNKLKLGAKGSLVTFDIKVEGGLGTKKVKQERQVGCCLGCKKVIQKMILQIRHKKECPCKEEHMKICNKLLEPKKQEAEPEHELVTVIKNMIEEIPENKGFLELNYPEVYATCCKN
jgi:hypothetical protein